MSAAGAGSSSRSPDSGTGDARVSVTTWPPACACSPVIEGTAAATPDPEARGTRIITVAAALGRRTRSTTSRPPSAPAWATTWMPGWVRPGPLLASGVGAVGLAPADVVDVRVDAGSPGVGALEDVVAEVVAEVAAVDTGRGSGVRPRAQSEAAPKRTANARPRMRWTITER